MPSSPRSVARGFDGAAKKGIGREFVSESKPRARRPARRPNGMTGPELLNSLGQHLGPRLQGKIEFRGESTFVILPTDLREVAQFCRDELSFDYLIDISSVDNFGDEPRFEIVY